MTMADVYEVKHSWLWKKKQSYNKKELQILDLKGFKALQLPFTRMLLENGKGHSENIGLFIS
ncbi:hypothetical protein [Virgibacillus pantothenticus]|uniref:hypothetical protein n=1 Tax=Virgibacillus pantothenticus TaxID=1473 RepID=UPI001C220E1F|nr:hypothetical protein [Virgibacillus pantothenticus]MBU8672150.1 hypothetical protein [Virgibacillus pantothenticus]